MLRICQSSGDHDVHGRDGGYQQIVRGDVRFCGDVRNGREGVGAGDRWKQENSGVCLRFCMGVCRNFTAVCPRKILRIIYGMLWESLL